MVHQRLTVLVSFYDMHFPFMGYIFIIIYSNIVMANHQQWGRRRVLCENEETIIDMEDLANVPLYARITVQSRGHVWCYDLRELAAFFRDRHARGLNPIYMDPRTNEAFPRRTLHRILENIALCYARGHPI